MAHGPALRPPSDEPPGIPPLARQEEGTPMTLRDELAEAEAKVEQIKRRMASATCRESGCDMQHYGGRNAACHLAGCACSVPVHVCTRCGDSDYGENDEAAEVRLACLERE
jgi:hypothetical protein